MSTLATSRLRKEFGDVIAVDGTSFEIENGEFVSVLGPSGSGKSTILRMIAGFETPTNGDITLAGESMVDTPPFERDINMVFQDLALFPHLNVAENIGYGLKQRGIPKDERRARAEDMLEMVRLEGYGERDVSELSGGEQQRVALARAIVNEPHVVLFDEPLSSLDRKLRQHMQSELQRIQEETGITFLYVTHDQEVALSVSDRLVVLNDGSIEQVGSVEDLYDRPATQFVADFIGDVNVFPAVVTDHEGDTATIEAENGVEYPVPSTAEWDVGTPVNVCIRPHKIGFASRREAVDTAFALPVSVTDIDYKGSDALYRAKSELGTLSAKIREKPERNDIEVAHWDGADTLLFERSET